MHDPPLSGDFHTTHWSLVLAAGSEGASRTRSRRALEELIRAYWFPVYAFVRFRGQAPHDAQDLTQAFFTRILETDGLGGASPERGRFRSYLLGAVKHFLANEWHASRRLKRGGAESFLEWDALDAEARYALEPAQVEDLDEAFDRDWAQATVARALERLREEAAGRGREELVDVLHGNLRGEAAPRQDLAARLGLGEGALKVALHRQRQRFRELLRAEIAATVADAAEVDLELEHLVRALRGTDPRAGKFEPGP